MPSVQFIVTFLKHEKLDIVIDWIANWIYSTTLMKLNIEQRKKLELQVCEQGMNEKRRVFSQTLKLTGYRLMKQEDIQMTFEF